MNHKEMIHQFLDQRIKPTDRVIDMTCGNGHDTYFLAKKAAEVYAVDIQKEAIESTKKRCQNFDNVKYFNIDHSKLKFEKKIDGAVYNLGYLPNGDKSIITNVETTIQSLKFIQNKDIRYLSIAAYPGHDGGKDEYEALQTYLDTHRIQYTLLLYKRPLSPVSFLIDFYNPVSKIILLD